MSTGIQMGLKTLLKFSSERLLALGTVRTYSVFNPYHVPPIVDKKKIAELEATGEIDRMPANPVLPPMKALTCSEFYDPTVSKFINFVMRRGKKELARSLVEESFEIIKKEQLRKYHSATPAERVNIILDPKAILHAAVENCKPVMELMGMKKGGSTYRVPIPVLEKRQRFLAMNWLIQASQEKNPRLKFSVQLAQELVDAANNTGRVVKKKQDLHKQCEANRAYAHFRWTI